MLWEIQRSLGNVFPGQERYFIGNSLPRKTPTSESPPSGARKEVGYSRRQAAVEIPGRKVSEWGVGQAGR